MFISMVRFTQRRRSSVFGGPAIRIAATRARPKAASKCPRFVCGWSGDDRDGDGVAGDEVLRRRELDGVDKTEYHLA